MRRSPLNGYRELCWAITIFVLARLATKIAPLVKFKIMKQYVANVKNSFFKIGCLGLWYKLNSVLNSE